MAWMNNDGLYIKYGTELAVPTIAGDYCMPGEMREQEFTINLANLTSTATIIADTTFFPAGMFIEEVTVDSEVSATGGTSLSVGLMNLDRSTTISDTEFLSAAPIADHTTAGQKKIYTVGVSGVGVGVGSTAANPGYVTAKAAGTYTAGRVKVRIKYRGLTATQ